MGKDLDLRGLAKLCLPIALLCGPLSACGKLPNEMRTYLMQEGDWGWQNGKGCEAQADIWRVEGEWIEIIRNGELMDRAKLLDRRILYESSGSGGAGPADGMIWQFIARKEASSRELGRHEMRFSLSGGPFRTAALVAWKKRSFMSVETREESRIKDPRGGQRLVPCAEVAP